MLNYGVGSILDNKGRHGIVITCTQEIIGSLSKMPLMQLGLHWFTETNWYETYRKNYEIHCPDTHAQGWVPGSIMVREKP